MEIKNKKVIFIFGILACVLAVLIFLGLRQENLKVSAPAEPASYELVDLINAAEFIKQSIDNGDSSCFDNLPADHLIYITQPLKSLIDDKNGFGNAIPAPTVTDYEVLKKEFCQSPLIKNLLHEINE